MALSHHKTEKLLSVMYCTVGESGEGGMTDTSTLESLKHGGFSGRAIKGHQALIKVDCFQSEGSALTFWLWYTEASPLLKSGL